MSLHDFVRFILFTSLPMLVVFQVWAGDVQPGLPQPVRMLNKAWAAYEQEKYAEAAVLADEVIKEFGADANKTQREFSAKNEPLPPTGVVSEAEKKRIFAFGPLNEVATAWWIKGRALAKEGRKDQAIEALRRAQEYPHARTYDKEWGGFWSPADKAQAWIDELQDAPPPPTPPRR